MTTFARSTFGLLLCFVGLGLAVSGQSPAYPLPAGTNVLVGRVLDIGTDAPVGGVVVTLLGNFDQDGRANPTLPRDAGSATNAGKNVFSTQEGHFVFRDLPAGSYVLAVRAFGYQNNDYPPSIVEVVDGTAPTSAELYVWRFGAIGGRVIDEAGDPVAGIPVTAFRRQVVNGRSVLLPQAEATSDDRGLYRIAQLPPGSYVVGAVPTVTSVPANLAAEVDARAANPQSAFNLTAALIPGGMVVRTGEGQRIGDRVLQRSGPPLPLSPTGAVLGYAHSYSPGTRNPDAAATITLGSGESRDDVDIPIRFADTVSVSGVLIGPEGPMANVAVQVVGEAGNASNFDQAGATQAVTDERGHFVVLGVVPGTYELKAAYSYGDSGDPSDSISLWARASVSVGDEPVAGLSLTMRPGVTFSGRATFVGSPEVVPSHSGRIPVMLRPFAANVWRSFPATVQPDGTFISVGDPPGRYIVNAFAPAGWFIQTMTLNGTTLVDDLIDIGDRDVTGLMLTYARTTTHIAGTIATSAGAADRGVDVFVFSADGATWRQGAFTTRRVRRVRATSSLAYEVSGMAPGEYYVAAVSSRFSSDWQSAEFLERLVPAAARITLAAGEQKPLNLSVITLRDR